VIEHLGLKVFPKVLGSTGIQLYLPLNTPSSYEVRQPLARSVAQFIEKQRPDLAF
jgi:bifunctional non-homologous end joining protein LigD